MKIYIPILLFTAMANYTLAQTNTFPASGNAGIGTTSPQKALHITGTGEKQALIETTDDGYAGLTLKSNNKRWEWSKRPSYEGDNLGLFYHNGTQWMAPPYMAVTPDGSVGLGTSSPRGAFDVTKNGDVYLSSTPNGGSAQSTFLSGHVYLAPYDNSNISYLQARRQNNQGSTELRIRTYNNNSLVDAMHISSAGNVGVGTTTPQAKLAVNGDIFSKKVKVTQTGWPDYVFHTTYRLRPLSEVEQYIQQYHHLPEVPSSEEVKKDGLDLGENQAVLLKKIEELTLYVIEQHKINKEQAQKLEQLQRKMDAWENSHSHGKHKCPNCTCQ